MLSSCAPSRSQLITLNSNNLKSTSQQSFAYDTDTLRLSYQFFSERGTVHFTIENKLSKPLYIDWQRSSFIIGQKKLDYWHDVASVNLNGSAYTSTYSRYLRNSSSSYSSISLNGKIQKDNFVDYIPPATKLDKSQFVVLPGDYLNLPGPFSVKQVPSTNSSTTKPVEIQEYQYTDINSPLSFRNYLTLSTDKEFKNEFVIDSKFWASTVQVMSHKQLTGGDVYEFDLKDSNSSVLKSLPYYRSNAFFINLNMDD